MNSLTACSRSWTDVNINFRNRTVSNCCKSVYHDMPQNYSHDFFDNSAQVQERRQDTLNGIQHQDCQVCWDDINKGNKSYIHWWNKWKDFSNQKPDVPQVNSIEFELDSTCDLSCLYCFADISSKIAQEEGKKVKDNITQHDIDVSKKYLKGVIEKSTDLVQITFSGGEPTASKLFYELIEYIGKLDNKNIKVDVVTNCNSKPFLLQKFIDVVDNFKGEMGITVSNESYGYDSELIRYGLDWERFEQNFHTYASHENVSHINLGLSVSNIALPSLHEYITWVYKTKSNYNKRFHFCGGMIDSPEELNVSILPVEYKSYVDQAIAVVHHYDKEDKSFLEFLHELRDRIGKNYQEDYKQTICEYLEKKQKVKKTDKLMKLVNFKDQP